MRPRVLRWGLPEQPLPRHPYRDSALMYAVFSALIVLVAWLTNGDLGDAVGWAVAFFVVAMAWSLRHWRRKLAEERSRAGAPRERPGARGRKR